MVEQNQVEDPLAMSIANMMMSRPGSVMDDRPGSALSSFGGLVRWGGGTNTPPQPLQDTREDQAAAPHHVHVRHEQPYVDVVVQQM